MSLHRYLSQALVACPNLAAVFPLMLMATSCGGDGDVTKPSGARDAGALADTSLPIIAACADADAGTSCGVNLYCIDGACQPGVCGDGVVTGGEACDDGNEQVGDGCDARCRKEAEGCGNAKVEDGEECDDGNLIDADACSNLCRVSKCGNSRIDRGEECDDGNQVDSDGCSKSCTLVACRNGRIDPGEECDDGNATDEGDGCTNACKISICGNGKVEKYEACDDGNVVDGDACPFNCKKGICGNGKIEPGEVCEVARIVTETVNGVKNSRYQSCAADCASWVSEAEDECLKCQRNMTAGCRHYQEINFLDGCLSAVGDEALGFGVDPLDPDFPNFIAKCVSIVQCALKNGCWLNPATGASGCYCGKASVDECGTQGPAADAPCVSEWQAGARSANNDVVQARFSDFAFPSAWAFFLLECYAAPKSSKVGESGCGHVCKPPVVPPAP